MRINGNKFFLTCKGTYSLSLAVGGCSGTRVSNGSCRERCTLKCGTVNLDRCCCIVGNNDHSPTHYATANKKSPLNPKIQG
jgi:hypothetical protein